MIKKFNISRPKKYFKDNVEKTMWQNVGIITEFHKQDGSVSRIIEIPAIGLQANIFPFEDKEAKPRDERKLETGYMSKPSSQTPEEEYNQYGSKEEVINSTDIPDDIPY